MPSPFVRLVRRQLLSLLSLLVLLASVARAARAAAPVPVPSQEEDAEDDLIADGDMDEDDRVVSHLGSHTGTADLHGASWVSLGAYVRQLLDGKNDFGGSVVLGLALDRLAAGPVHRIADPPQEARPATAVASLAPGLAHECVVAAWRTAGLGSDDARIDAIVARSRSSAWLPETRLRAMRLWTDASHATLLATTDGTSYYDAVGANLVLEARFTWRLDRLVYAGDEPTLERVRLERQDARSRLGTRTLEALFAWQRARLDETEAVTGSRDQIEAALRVAEGEANLDVLTGGWFSAHGEAP